MSNNVKPLNGNGSWLQYALNKRERNNYTVRFNCEGECYYIKGGQQLTEQEFNELLPIGLINRSKYSDRADSRQNYTL